MSIQKWSDLAKALQQRGYISGKDFKKYSAGQLWRALVVNKFGMPVFTSTVLRQDSWWMGYIIEGDLPARLNQLMQTIIKTQLKKINTLRDLKRKAKVVFIDGKARYTEEDEKAIRAAKISLEDDIFASYYPRAFRLYNYTHNERAILALMKENVKESISQFIKQEIKYKQQKKSVIWRDPNTLYYTSYYSQLLKPEEKALAFPSGGKMIWYGGRLFNPLYLADFFVGGTARFCWMIVHKTLEPKNPVLKAGAFILFGLAFGAAGLAASMAEYGLSFFAKGFTLNSLKNGLAGLKKCCHSSSEVSAESIDSDGAAQKYLDVNKSQRKLSTVKMHSQLELKPLPGLVPAQSDEDTSSQVELVELTPLTGTTAETSSAESTARVGWVSPRAG